MIAWLYNVVNAAINWRHAHQHSLYNHSKTHAPHVPLNRQTKQFHQREL